MNSTPSDRSGQSVPLRLKSLSDDHGAEAWDMGPLVNAILAPRTICRSPERLVPYVSRTDMAILDTTFAGKKLTFDQATILTELCDYSLDQWKDLLHCTYKQARTTIDRMKHLLWRDKMLSRQYAKVLVAPKGKTLEKLWNQHGRAYCKKMPFWPGTKFA
jgi:hypothetical protein